LITLRRFCGDNAEIMDQLEEVKQKINLIELINEYVPLKKAGRNFKALCPFHSETAPSFIVSPERQIWKCFGCGEGGDAFGFLMKIEGMEFGEALRKLAKKAGVKLRPFEPSETYQKKQQFWEINHLASEFYHYLLLKHRVGKKALAYILNRGISKELLKLFKLGFAPNMWDGLQRFLVKKKGYRLNDLREVGLIIKGRRRGFYDRFRGRLMFPLRDHQGNICGFAGRVLQKEVKDLPAGRQGPKYINSPETPVYHKSRLLYGLWLTRREIKKADAVVLVEGELDAISSWQAGVKNVVAIKGSALTGDQLNLLKRFTQNLVLAPDSDLAGDAVARRGIELADSLGFSIKVVQIRGGKDPDEVAQKDPRFWQKQVSQAVPIYDYFLDSALARFDVKTAEGKRKTGQELVPILAKISDNIVRGHYVAQLASRLGVSQEAVIREVEKRAGQTPSASLPKTVLEATKKERQEVLEEYLFALCLQSKNWSVLTKRRVKKLITSPAFLGIAEKISKYLKKYKTIKSERLAKMLPAELTEIFDRLYLYDLGDWLEKEEKVKKEIAQTIRELEKISLKKRLSLISQKIKELEREKGDPKEIKKLNEEFRDFSTKLVEFAKI
jgi:DNA primase